MLFKTSAQDLRWLCYTLTGDQELTEMALEAALVQSLKGATQVFRGWLLNWMRRLIIKFCASIMQPGKLQLAESAYRYKAMGIDANSSHLMRIHNSPSDILQKALLRLDALSRFVFVLRGLEAYSRRDTSLLLNIDDHACDWIYYRAASALYSEIEQNEIDCNREEQVEYAFAMAGD
jgi:DNA-directed RNA polymerase specialized sigma24 family protein